MKPGWETEAWVSGAVWEGLDGWHHTDETYSETFGPFKSRDEALASLGKYCDWLEDTWLEAQ